MIVVGGGNSAGQAAMYFAKYARSVTMLVRGSLLGRHMSDYLVRQIKGTDNINVRLRTVLVEAHGDDHLEGVTVRNLNTDEKETLSAAALFILIGARPNTEWLAGVVERDSAGFILSGPDLMVDGQRPKGWPLDRDPYLLETSVPGIFVAGDVRHRSVKRVAAAVGEGSMAIQFVHLYLGSL